MKPSLGGSPKIGGSHVTLDVVTRYLDRVFPCEAHAELLISTDVQTGDVFVLLGVGPQRDTERLRIPWRDLMHGPALLDHDALLGHWLCGLENRFAASWARPGLPWPDCLPPMAWRRGSSVFAAGVLFLRENPECDLPLLFQVINPRVVLSVDDHVSEAVEEVALAFADVSWLDDLPPMFGPTWNRAPAGGYIRAVPERPW